MKYANNGAAIIGGSIVPATELLVLKTLATFKESVAVSQIAKALNEQISDASLYTLLKRLQKRGLVSREDAVVEVFGRSVQRVLWHAHQAAADFFIDERITRHETETSDSTGGAAMAM